MKKANAQTITQDIIFEIITINGHGRISQSTLSKKKIIEDVKCAIVIRRRRLLRASLKLKQLRTKDEEERKMFESLVEQKTRESEAIIDEKRRMEEDMRAQKRTSRNRKRNQKGHEKRIQKKQEKEEDDLILEFEKRLAARQLRPRLQLSKEQLAAIVEIISSK
jgi:hypothetical protein